MNGVVDDECSSSPSLPLASALNSDLCKSLPLMHVDVLGSVGGPGLGIQGFPAPPARSCRKNLINRHPFSCWICQKWDVQASAPKHCFGIQAVLE